jgi:hypothetical protein
MTTYLPFRVRSKLFLKKLLPSKIFSFVQKVWVHTFASFVRGQDILLKYTKIFLSRNPVVVQAGPFKGLQYVDKAIGSSYLHKLIGSYEAVLHPYIEAMRHKKFDTILDIGSAEGYYLIGFGSLFPEAHLIGFELEQKGRELSREMYKKNNLLNELSLFGEATKENVAPLITKNTLLICDCEGGEVDILDPQSFPSIFNFDTAIIELHDFIRPNAKEILTERFKDTHKITIVPFALADPKAFPFFTTVANEKDLYELRRERGCQDQEWMVLERKQ